jgi:8-oxo-dGTP pyrophosphatase MutT (NUDIX family)
MNDSDRAANGSDNVASRSRDGSGGPSQRPRDAATLVLVDTTSGVPKVLEMKGRPSEVRARALALAAIRETFEETGVIVGRTSTAQAPRSTDLPPAWRAFHDAGFEPLLSELCFFARAITPPGRPRRYDTRFFCASANLIAAETGASDEELDRIGWFSLAETKDLDLPPITRVILEDLVDGLDAGRLGPLPHPVPFYHHRRGSFVREFLGDDR